MGQGSQHNKAHKPGRQAGLSARQRHKEKKECGPRVAIKAIKPAQNKAERLNASKQLREKKRAQLVELRRSVGPPVVVALLPLSAAVDVQQIWHGLIIACSDSQDNEGLMRKGTGMDTTVELPARLQASSTLTVQTLSLAERRKARFTTIPPPLNRADPLAVVELGKSAEVVLLAMPGGEDAETIDEEGKMALSVLRALGMPTAVGLVQSDVSSGTKNMLKQRSAARKHAAAAFSEHVAGDHKLMAADTLQDFRQLLRHLSDSPYSPPLWRQQRPAVMVEAAEFHAAEENLSLGTLLLRGYIRGLGLSANQALHIPGVGDFNLSQISGPQEPLSANEQPGSAAARQRQQAGSGPLAMDAEGRGGSEVLAVLATADPARRESLTRENIPDPLAGEQTWPTQEELMDAEAARRQAKGMRKRRLPKGTSEYQAAWILDDDASDGSNCDDDDEGNGSQKMGDEDDSLPEPEPNVGDAVDMRDVDAGTEFGLEADEDEEEEGKLAAMLRQIKERRRREEEDQQFPDEIDTPVDVPARQRFDKYRGLKSFRTSPWDPKETLPQDYARVFAFENFKRTQKRAKAAAASVGKPGDVDGVPAGTYVQLHVEGVPSEAAQHVLSRVAAAVQAGGIPPLVVTGLLQHECKLCVVNYGLRKASTYSEPLASKEPLLFVTGLRSFIARPVYSTDEHGADKHKMERFLHENRPSIATVYAPICYGPLPLLAFKMSPEGAAELAATGSLRSCDPDRIILKKIVLSGYPVKTHKSKAMVRFMFHNPDDIRWFRPVELWTKYGRRGRIREPVGTHGAMKCIFDGPVQQRDAVCMSLYKRVYPKWPEDSTFAA